MAGVFKNLNECVPPRRSLRKAPLALAVVLLLGAPAWFPIGAAAASPLCGSTLTESTTLSSDLICLGDGLSIGANGVKLDCAGHSITGIGNISDFHTGVKAAHQKGVTITNCTIVDFVWGIVLDQTSKSRVVHNDITGRDIPLHRGISVHVMGQSNQVVNNTSNSQDSGFWLDQKSNLLAGNVADDNSFGYYIGARAVLRHNVATNSRGTGFLINSGSNIIAYNVANSTEDAGFHILSGRNVIVGNLAVSDHGGIVIDGPNNRVMANLATDSKKGNSSPYEGAGFVLESSGSNLLRGNVASDNQGDGFRDEWGTRDVYSSNLAFGNGGSGFNFTGATQFRIVQGNNATSNGRDGFSDDSGMGGVFSSNSAQNNGGDGFVLKYSYGYRVLMTSSTGNGGNGYTLNDSFGDRLKLNSAVGNLGDGFSTVGLNGSDNIFNGNFASGGQGFGFYDETNGTRLWGTSNTYRFNTCGGNRAGSSSPLGLCPYSGIVAGRIIPLSLTADQGQTLNTTLLAHPLGGVKPLTYQWYDAERCTSPVIGATGSSLSISTSVPKEYSYRVNDSASTSACSPAAKAIFMPPLNISVAPFSTSVVVNSSAFIWTQVSGGSPPYAYQWYNGAGCLGPNVIVGETASYLLTPRILTRTNFSLLVTDGSKGIPAGGVCTDVPVYATRLSNRLSISQARDELYVDNYAGGTMTILNTTDGAVIAQPPQGTFSTGMALNPLTNLVYVTNGYSGTVTVINGTSYSNVATITVPGWPSRVTVNPSTNMVYTVDDTGDVGIINGTTNVFVKEISGLGFTSDIAVNPVTNLVYVAQNGNLTVIDGSTNTVKARFFAGGEGSSQVAVNTVTNMIYLTNSYYGAIRVINGTNDSWTTSIPDQGHLLGMVVDPTTNRVYVSNFNGTLAAFDGATNAALGHANVGIAIGLCVDEVANKVYAVDLLRNSITVVNGTSFAIEDRFYLP